MEVQTDVQFMPTPVFVEGFGEKEALRQAKECRREAWSDKLEAIAKEKPLEKVELPDQEEQLIAALAVGFGLGFLIGLGVGYWICLK